MKLKIKIAGPLVHEVGYRYFLMSNAIDIGLKGFHARNRTGEREQEVIALIEGDEETIADFKKLIENRKPDHSQVSSIAFEDYNGDVMKTEGYAQICSAVQLNKAIPLLLDIRNDTKEMKGDMKEMKGDMKEMKGDMKEMKGDVKAVRKNTEETLEEIKDIRGDIQPGYGMTLRQVQSDIRPEFIISFKKRLHHIEICRV